MQTARKSPKSSKSPNAVVLAADVGGTNLRCALVSPGGKVIRSLETGSRPGERPAEMVKLLAQSFGRLLKESGRRGRPPAVGIGVAGGVDAHRGVVTQCPQFPKWKNFALGPLLAKEMKLPQGRVRVRNDVDCALMGESWRGAVRGDDNVLAYWLGTGVGGALILNGALWHGPSGMAGEIGHTIAQPGGARCNCGARGCLETLASGTAVARLAEERGLAAKGIVSARQVFEAAEAGQVEALGIWRVVGKALGESVGGMVNLLSIDTVVIGGKLSRASRFFLPELRRAAKARAFHYPGSRLRIRIAELGDDAGLLGAAACALGRGD